ncbi:LysR family transcriptional regulator [Paraburkholderia domus]|uniref:LysR family transcriptional regulator n=1 Tax=Paraburkholderia domus TaxID=2793075 RepID=UPI001B059DC0|nr:LysR family transcriptional regulator [Paraburkholderia domus]CAE6841245.1 HTH-type transcriptional regulator DmlR [Paraburkholderia domus]
MKPLNSDDIQAFLLTVEWRSITEAARRLNLSKSVISKRVSDLERDIGVQLLMRSTRNILPTDAGLTLYEAGSASMRRLADAVDLISEQSNGLCGELRITAPVSLTHLWLGDVIARFAAAHPRLHVLLELDDRLINIEAERLDLAIRVARLPDSSLIARRIGVSERVIVASPGYVEKHGMPDSLDDVSAHRCLCYSNVPASQTWSFPALAPRSKPRTLAPQSVFGSNNGEALRDAAVRGLGLAILPTFIAARDLVDGRLVRILPDEPPEDDIIYAVYPRGPFTSHKLRAFVEHVRLALLVCPWDQLTTAAPLTESV